ncbi:hypothetical protein [Paenibacillus alginolyticus]|uniref:hypothetical protein n=1 Tax=Paenibacillus alginolyticus TaxID=59839 RepID=UPI002DBD5003|nr:hypothetical protein [Paenibacillus alginolyticus]MEC0147924.1 hypothetical protein [Paenibacillus alginolyticus]
MGIVHTGDFRPKHFGVLNCECANAAPRTIDENPLALSNLSFIAQSLQSEYIRLWNCRRLLKGEPRRLWRQSWSLAALDSNTRGRASIKWYSMPCYYSYTT